MIIPRDPGPQWDPMPTQLYSLSPPKSMVPEGYWQGQCQLTIMFILVILCIIKIGRVSRFSRPCSTEPSRMLRLLSHPPRSTLPPLGPTWVNNIVHLRGKEWGQYGVYGARCGPTGSMSFSQLPLVTMPIDALLGAGCGGGGILRQSCAIK